MRLNFRVNPIIKEELENIEGKLKEPKYRTGQFSDGINHTRPIKVEILGAGNNGIILKNKENVTYKNKKGTQYILPGVYIVNLN